MVKHFMLSYALYDFNATLYILLGIIEILYINFIGQNIMFILILAYDFMWAFCFSVLADFEK